MKPTTTEPIAREGWWYTAGAATLLLAAFAWDWSAVSKLLVVAFLLFVLWFFRNPERIAAADEPSALLSPTDGKIVSIDRMYEPRWIGAECLCVTIHTRLYDAHLVRSPLAGDFAACEIEHGLFLPLSDEKAEQLNEKLRLKVDYAPSSSIVISILAGVLKTRLLPYVSAGQKVRTAQRLGFVRAEFKTVLFLPENSTLKVAVGDTVRAGETSLGTVGS